MLRARNLNRLLPGALLLSLLCQTPFTNTEPGRDLTVATAKLGASTLLGVAALHTFCHYLDCREILWRAQKPRLPEYAAVPRNIGAKKIACVVALFATTMALYGAYYFGKSGCQDFAERLA